jgi:hypothetical protein
MDNDKNDGGTCNRGYAIIVIHAHQSCGRRGRNLEIERILLILFGLSSGAVEK